MLQRQNSFLYSQHANSEHTGSSDAIIRMSEVRRKHGNIIFWFWILRMKIGRVVTWNLSQTGVVSYRISYHSRDVLFKKFVVQFSRLFSFDTILAETSG